MTEGTEKTYLVNWKCPECGGTELIKLEEAVVSRQITTVKKYTSPNGNHSWLQANLDETETVEEIKGLIEVCCGDCGFRPIDDFFVLTDIIVDWLEENGMIDTKDVDDPVNTVEIV